MRKKIELGDGRKVTLIGTAHVSEESRKEVKETIKEEEPDFVGVELDKSRLESLRGDSVWTELDVAEAVKDGKGFLLLLNLLLSIYQKRLGLERDIKPGEELLEAVESAEENDIDVGLIDRDINETLSRTFSSLSLWEKMKLLTVLFIGDDEIEIEDLKDQQLLDSLVEELESSFPSIKEKLLDERNDYMTEKILNRDFEHAVAVVGAAHVDGMKEALEEKRKYNAVELEKGFPWLKTVKYGFPLFIISMMGYSFYRIGIDTGVQATAFWILSNGIMSMLGAILARSHVLTWVTSFVAAPLTSLNPTIGAGMVASYAEAKFYPPTVKDLESIAFIDNYRDLWFNQVGRILLTFLFVTLGSAVATWTSAGFIASLIL